MLHSVRKSQLMTRYLLPFILALSLCTIVCRRAGVCQTPSYRLNQFSVGEGLKHPQISSSAIDDDGFIWVGTRAGLARFDGYRFEYVDLPKHPEHTEGNRGPWVGKICKLNDGTFLLSYVVLAQTTELAGLDIFDPKSGTLVEHIESESLLSLARSCGPSYFLQARPGDTLRSSDELGNQILSFVDNRKHHTILHLRDGREVELTAALPFLLRETTFLGRDFSKSIFFGSESGLYNITFDFAYFQSYLHKSSKSWEYGLKIRALVPFDQDLLVASVQEPMGLLDLETGICEKVDFAYGVIQSDNQTKNLYNIVHRDDSILWFANASDDLIRVDWPSKTSKFVPVPKPRDYFHCIGLDNGNIVTAEVRSKGDLWIQIYDPASGRSEGFQLLSVNENQNDIVNVFMLEDSDQTLWIAHSTGLHHFDLKTRQVMATYGSAHQNPSCSPDTSASYSVLSDKTIYVLAHLDGEHLMIGTQSAGLDILNKLTNQVVRTITELNGLANNTVASILSDSNRLYVGTYYGLSVIDKKTWAIRNFFVEHGLPHNEFNRHSFTQTSDGLMVLGTMNGLTSFRPKELANESSGARLFLTGYSIVNIKDEKQHYEMNFADPTTTFKIPAHNRSCSFSFMMNDMQQVENNSFQYALVRDNMLLSNRDTSWISHGTDPTIRFDYLPSGDYNLLVKGLSASGQQTNTLLLRLHVAEYFFRSPQFFLLMSLIAIGLFYFFYRMRLNQLRRIEGLRRKLSSDLHDDVGSLLSGIAYQMEFLELTSIDDNKGIIKKLAASSRQAMNRMRDVVWAIDSGSITGQDLVDRLQEFAKDILDSAQVNWHQQIDEGAIATRIPSKYRHDTLLILKEFITNTVKHANANNVYFTMAKSKKALEIQLRDDGRGIDQMEESHAGIGLKNMWYRADKMGAKLLLKNDDGLCMRLTIYL